MVPTRAQIAPDLALAVSRARMAEARDTCALVLSRSDLADDESAAAFCADILASLIDLDYHRAEKSATRLVLNKQFQSIADVRRVHIDRELARWKSGQPSQLDATDFWEWLTTALASIARSFGYSFETNEFADNNWTKEAN